MRGAHCRSLLLKLFQHLSRGAIGRSADHKLFSERSPLTFGEVLHGRLDVPRRQRFSLAALVNNVSSVLLSSVYIYSTLRLPRRTEALHNLRISFFDRDLRT